MLPMMQILPACRMPEGMVQDGLSAPDDQGVAGIVAPLEPGDHIGVFRINIDDFSFSLVTPLGADHNHVCHSDDSPIEF